MERTPGITMLLRLKNEEEWIEPCLRSIEWADRIVLCFQNCTDRTEEICRDVADPARASLYHYGYDSKPNGPGHANQPYDQYNRAYFYNWCYRKTDTKYVVKWDGDMIAVPEVETFLRKAEADELKRVSFLGTNIVIKEGKWYVNKTQEFTGSEPRFFQAEDKDPWVIGRLTQRFNYPTYPGKNLAVKESAYLHFKYGKCLESATKAWPTNWKDIPHFQMLHKRGTPDDPNDLIPYTGPVPECIPPSHRENNT